MLFDFKIFSFSNIFMEYFIFSSKKKKGPKGQDTSQNFKKSVDEIIKQQMSALA